ncbi:MAG: ABC transporter permease [Dictyoglomaceae bacterium]|nr:ABC transporter permease [Dictyoglomaceae bacterium]
MREIIILLFRSKRFMSGFILFLIILSFGILGPIIYPQDPFRMVGGLFSPPSEKYILGTDNLGRDVFVELMHGIRTSLLIGATAGMIATFIGVSLGSIAGYKGGILEEILMGITNVLITIPSIVILILLSVALKTRSPLTMGIVIGITSWPWTARAVRAQTSSLKTREHIDLAKITGFSTFEMIVFEILPYMFSYIFMAFILQFSIGIFNEATLSMLGLGPFQTVSLGVMLHWALLWEAVRTGAWWAFIPPVICLSITTFSLMSMNAGMDEIFNPKLRR